ncbi:C2H2-type zinc finger protein [Aspergillus undulatus]|uniref:C2H2-type zinc finger protein n=1 Tax=Aspergillus undulatus TaxID=1810928 RepID=UPI003CCD90E8
MEQIPHMAFSPLNSSLVSPSYTFGGNSYLPSSLPSGPDAVHYYPKNVRSAFDPMQRQPQDEPKPIAKPYSCKDCGKSFTRAADLKRHQRSVHYPVFNDCPVPDCQRKGKNGFPRRDHLVEHIRSYHHMDVPKRRAAKRLVTRKKPHGPQTPTIADTKTPSLTQRVTASQIHHLETIAETTDELTECAENNLPNRDGKDQMCISSWLQSVRYPSSLSESQTRHTEAHLQETKSLVDVSNSDKLRSDMTSSDLADFDMFTDSDSVFGTDGWTSQLEENHDSDSIRRLRVLYANCLYSLIHRQIFFTPPVNARACGSGSQSASISGATNSSTPQRKRSWGQAVGSTKGGSNDERKDDDSNDPGPLRPSRRQSAKGSAPRRLACPFFKRNPNIFISCGLSDHESSSRVKLHINRKHKLPIYCPRCSEVFKSEQERDVHLRENTCPLQPEVRRICATSEQLQRLSRRSTAKTDRDRWNEIYRILFPDDPLPDSPYLDPTVSAEVNLVREAFLSAAPSAVRTALRLAIPGALPQIADDELDRIVSSTHVEVFDQVLSRIQSSRPLQAWRSHVSPSFHLNTPETSDSGSSCNINPSNIHRGPEPNLESQMNSSGGDLELGIEFQSNTVLPLPPLFSDLDLELMAMSCPVDWSFGAFT